MSSIRVEGKSAVNGRLYLGRLGRLFRSRNESVSKKISEKHMSEQMQLSQDYPSQPSQRAKLTNLECSSSHISVAETFKRNFIGQIVRFVPDPSLYENPEIRTSGNRLQGEVVSQKYVGRTKVGNIPDYRLEIKVNEGNKESRFSVSLVESYVREV